RPDLDPRVDSIRRGRDRRMDDRVAADYVGALDADQVQGYALAPLGVRGLVAVHLHGAHASFFAAGQNPHRLAGGDPSGDRGSCDHDPVTLHDERTVDGHAKGFAGAGHGDTGDTAADLDAKLLDAAPRERGNQTGRCTLEHRVDRQDVELFTHLGDACLVDEVNLGDDDDAALDAEQMEDVQVLFGLRHHAVVGGDDEQHAIDAVGAREHV